MSFEIYGFACRVFCVGGGEVKAFGVRRGERCRSDVDDMF